VPTGNGRIALDQHNLIEQMAIFIGHAGTRERFGYSHRRGRNEKSGICRADMDEGSMRRIQNRGGVGLARKASIRPTPGALVELQISELTK
jgi:hypothetical protein